jgi:hypothetical protein
MNIRFINVRPSVVFLFILLTLLLRSDFIHASATAAVAGITKDEAVRTNPTLKTTRPVCEGKAVGLCGEDAQTESQPKKGSDEGTVSTSRTHWVIGLAGLYLALSGVALLALLNSAKENEGRLEMCAPCGVSKRPTP